MITLHDADNKTIEEGFYISSDNTPFFITTSNNQIMCETPTTPQMILTPETALQLKKLEPMEFLTSITEAQSFIQKKLAEKAKSGLEENTKRASEI
jgi:hypothetical protein